MMDLKQHILEASDLKREPVDVPEWSVTVYVGVMSGSDRSKWNESAFDAEGNLVTAHYQSRLLVYCLTDAEGKRVFDEADVEALEQKNSEVLGRLFLIAKRLNGLGPAESDAAKKD